MLIAEELKTAIEKLQAIASPKELAFFQFLINEPAAYPKGQTPTEIEQICFGAFCSDPPDQKPLVNKYQKTQPIKGMHYTNNLIELAAFALTDSNKESENLKSFTSKHSTRDYFVLNKLFPGKLSYPPSPISDIDKMAAYLLNNDFPKDWESTFYKAITSSFDLLDVFVLREAYLYRLERHPVTKLKSNINILSQQLIKTIHRVEIFTHIILILLLIIGFIAFHFKFIPYILNQWDVAEAKITATELVLVSINSVLGIAFRKALDSLVVFLGIETHVTNLFLRIMGINRASVDQALEKTENNNSLFLSAFKP